MSGRSHSLVTEYYALPSPHEECFLVVPRHGGKEETVDTNGGGPGPP